MSSGRGQSIWTGTPARKALDVAKRLRVRGTLAPALQLSLARTGLGLQGGPRSHQTGSGKWGGGEGGQSLQVLSNPPTSSNRKHPRPVLSSTVTLLGTPESN